MQEKIHAFADFENQGKRIVKMSFQEIP